MSTLVSGVRGLTSRLLHLHAGESTSEVHIWRGLAGMDAESSCARGQPMGYRTPLALVGKGRPRAAAQAHWMGRAIARSVTGRARPRQTRRRNERSNGRTSGSPPRAPPMGTAPSTAGQRTAHPWPLLPLRHSQMVAGRIHNTSGKW